MSCDIWGCRKDGDYYVIWRCVWDISDYFTFILHNYYNYIKYLFIYCYVIIAYMLYNYYNIVVYLLWYCYIFICISFSSISNYLYHTIPISLLGNIFYHTSFLTLSNPAKLLIFLVFLAFLHISCIIPFILIFSKK